MLQETCSSASLLPHVPEICAPRGRERDACSVINCGPTTPSSKNHLTPCASQNSNYYYTNLFKREKSCFINEKTYVYSVKREDIEGDQEFHRELCHQTSRAVFTHHENVFVRVWRQTGQILHFLLGRNRDPRQRACSASMFILLSSEQQLIISSCSKHFLYFSF